LREHVDGLDGVVHSIGFAPQEAMGDGFTEVPWEFAATAFQVSSWSLASLTQACRPLFGDKASVVGLTFDATVAWPVYGWMGAAKAALESTSRYLARELGPEGVRVNLVAAGPLRTMAMKSIPGSSQFEEAWEKQAPLGWSVTDTEPSGKAVCALLSDWFPATTGEIVHVDGGFHAVGV
jgi:meromycolic acid enoyl-[acyl-carrier-protein] reductase